MICNIKTTIFTSQHCSINYFMKIIQLLIFKHRSKITGIPKFNARVCFMFDILKTLILFCVQICHYHHRPQKLVFVQIQLADCLRTIDMTGFFQVL